MIIDKLLRELIGPETEFKQVTVYLPLDDHERAAELAADLGVPVGRLLAELASASIPEAAKEWRTLKGGRLEDAFPSTEFSIRPRVK